MKKQLFNILLVAIAGFSVAIKSAAQGNCPIQSCQQYITQAQLPPNSFPNYQNKPEQDCANAIPLCKGVYQYPNGAICGPGAVACEVPANGTFSCLGQNEKATVWFKFKVNSVANGNKLKFRIIPNDVDMSTVPANDNGTNSFGSLDFDFQLFNVTNFPNNPCAAIKNGSAILPGGNQSGNGGCNYSGTAGPTGLWEPFTTSIGSRYNPPLTVSVGQTFYLVVDRWTTSNAPTPTFPGGVLVPRSEVGFSIDFTGSQADIIFAPEQPEIDTILNVPNCLNSELVFRFTKSVLCETVDTSDFEIVGPNPNGYTITEVTPVSGSCTGADTLQEYRLVFSPAAVDTGYALILKDSIFDFCGNFVKFDTLKFDIAPFIAAKVFPEKDSILCFDGAMAIIQADTSLPGKHTYKWYGEGLQVADTLRNIVVLPPSIGTFTYKLVSALNTCKDSVEVKVTAVGVSQITSITPDDSICFGVSKSLSVVSENLYGNDAYLWSVPTYSPADDSVYALLDRRQANITVTPLPRPLLDDSVYNYRVRVTSFPFPDIKDQFGNVLYQCVVNKPVVIKVGSALKPLVTSDTVRGLIPLTISFSDSGSVGRFRQYSWDFDLGDNVPVPFVPFFSNSTFDTAHTYNRPGSYEAQLSVKDYLNCEAKSNKIFVEAYLPVLPNVITVDGNNLNEHLDLSRFATKQMSLQIFNRWGQKIYENSDYKNDFDASKLQSGTYFMLLKDNINEFEYKGWLKVMR